MRRTFMLGTLVATILVLLGMMVGVGIGQNTAIHGGSPSDVYMLREPTQEGCVPDRVNTDGVSVMPLQFTLAAPSHVLVSFSFEVAGIDPREQVQVNPQLDGSGDDFSWLFVGNSRETVPGSVTSVFPDQGTGTHTVDIYAAVAGRRGQVDPALDASLGSCVLSVFVMPAAV